MIVTSYETYLKMQMAGPVEKPDHYHNAERIAINELFDGIPKDARILDVGCAIGLGIKYLESIGYENVYGIDIDSRKVRLAAEKTGIQNIMLGDIADFDFADMEPFDIIYSSHCLEHVFNIEEAVEGIMAIATDDAKFIIILPYPNPNPSPAHWSTPRLGLDINDGGVTVESWFGSKGFVITSMKFDDYREPEIWMTMVKE